MKNLYIYLSTLIILTIIFAMAIPLLDWQVYSPHGIDRQFVYKIFHVLVLLQAGWILLFPLFIKGSKWKAIGFAILVAFVHLVSSLFASMAISGTWL